MKEQLCYFNFGHHFCWFDNNSLHMNMNMATLLHQGPSKVIKVILCISPQITVLEAFTIHFDSL